MTNEETVCHCNCKENAELICKILDYDAAGEVFPLPEVEVAQGDCTDIRLMNEVLNGLEEMLTTEIQLARKSRRDPDRSKDAHLLFQGSEAAYMHCFNWLGERWCYVEELR